MGCVIQLFWEIPEKLIKGVSRTQFSNTLRLAEALVNTVLPPSQVPSGRGPSARASSLPWCPDWLKAFGLLGDN
jgi:hypothetical protein